MISLLPIDFQFKRCHNLMIGWHNIIVESFSAELNKTVSRPAFFLLLSFRYSVLEIALLAQCPTTFHILFPQKQLKEHTF